MLMGKEARVIAPHISQIAIFPSEGFPAVPFFNQETVFHPLYTTIKCIQQQIDMFVHTARESNIMK